MKLEEAVQGVLDAEQELRLVGNDLTQLSKYMYELGQYASACEKTLGEYERDYEVQWAITYKTALTNKMSVTAAKQHADTENAETKGQIKYLTRFVASAWKVQTAAMARHKHLLLEVQSTNV